jgi:hypothetical protein
MKTRQKIYAGLALAFLTLNIASCTVFKKILPPGQAKKITGQQNASSLAPGKK